MQDHCIRCRSERQWNNLRKVFYIFHRKKRFFIIVRSKPNIKMKFPSSWTPSEVEVAEAYGDTLSNLKMNSKPIINTLTELANAYSKEHSNVIVYLIEERIKEVYHSFYCLFFCFHLIFLSVFLTFKMLYYCVLSFYIVKWVKNIFKMAQLGKLWYVGWLRMCICLSLSHFLCYT